MTIPPTGLTPMRPAVRLLLAVTVITVVVAILAAILTIPFLFESQTMYYKFGWKKAMLRAGKMVGLAAAFLIFIQLALAGRLKWLDRIFSLPALYAAHRFVAYTIITLVALHPVLVFAPDSMYMIPLEGRYWPEWVGAGALLLIVLQFGFSRWRQKIFKAYQKWLLVHRIGGFAALAMITLHVLYVSETFEQSGIPRNLLVISASGIVALWLWIRLRGKLGAHKEFSVSQVKPAGEDAFAIHLEPRSAKRMDYMPGQFAILSFNSAHISQEPHPFTVSSSPTRTESIEFTIRTSGDWTRKLDGLEIGDRAMVQGPFGRFSHLAIAPRRTIVMIAGGIGITPMLSMLRYMSDTGDHRQTTLIWSNQTPDHLFSGRELDALSDQLTDFRWIPIFTREKGKIGHFGRLDKQKLESMLQPHGRDAAIFLCGPPAMIQQVRKDLTRLGFPKRSIHFEAFGF